MVLSGPHGLLGAYLRVSIKVQRDSVGPRSSHHTWEHKYSTTMKKDDATHKHTSLIKYFILWTYPL